MNPAQQMTNTTGVTGGEVHLILTTGDLEKMPIDPERLMEEIELRSTQIGSVLEGILNDPHGQSRWGLNE